MMMFAFMAMLIQVNAMHPTNVVPHGHDGKRDPTPPLGTTLLQINTLITLTLFKVLNYYNYYNY